MRNLVFSHKVITGKFIPIPLFNRRDFFYHHVSACGMKKITHHPTGKFPAGPFQIK